MEYTISDATDQFSLEELKIHWNTFAENRKSQGLQNDYILLSNKELHIDNDFLIHITLDNHIQVEQLNEIRFYLLEFLRKKLNNYKINIQCEVREAEKQTGLIYTNQDKLNYLIEKYPALGEMKKRLGLDIDY